MSTNKLLKTYINEVLADMPGLNQNIVRRDPAGTGKLAIRKLVTYVKDGSRFTPGDDVDAELRKDGTVEVDDLENWKPQFGKTLLKPRASVEAEHDQPPVEDDLSDEA